MIVLSLKTSNFKGMVGLGVHRGTFSNYMLLKSKHSF